MSAYLYLYLAPPSLPSPSQPFLPPVGWKEEQGGGAGGPRARVPSARFARTNMQLVQCVRVRVCVCVLIGE